MLIAVAGQEVTGSTQESLYGLAFGIAGNVAGTVYGTVVALATLTAAFEEEKHPARLAGIVGASAVVLWLAHVHAHVLGDSLSRGRRFTFADVKRIAFGELGILLSAAGPTIALVLGALGVLEESSAVRLAFAAGFGTLFAVAVRFARIERLGTGGSALVITANLSLGLIIVALKVLVAH